MNTEIRSKLSSKSWRVRLGAVAIAVCLPAVAYASTAEGEIAKKAERQPTPAQIVLPAAQKARSFTHSFSHIDTSPAAHRLVPGAVDITAIKPPIEKEEKIEKVSSEVRKVLRSGNASYYGKRFAGRLTANGERFNPGHMTAAHKTLPFGSKVRVTNKSNGRSVVVRINDRGPYAHGRVIDLSRAAAAKIGLISRGHGPVKLELLK